jgi:hypothetical protein
MTRILLLVAGAFVALACAQLASADARFIDPTGDSGAAPDIVAATAANDAAGNLTFTVQTNQATVASNAVVLIAFDLDDNPDTGGDGVESAVFLGSAGWQFMKWNGTQFAPGSAPSANASYANGVLTFKIGKADLGETDDVFAFWAGSLQFDAAGEVVASDAAPDGAAAWIYEITKPKPLTLRAGAVTATPAAPKAGKPFAVRTPITRGDTGGPLAGGAVTCTVRVGATAVRAAGRVGNGVAACTMTIPKNAKGKLVRGTIKVTFEGVSTTKTFSYRVR